MILTGTLGSSRVLEEAWTQGRHVAPLLESLKTGFEDGIRHAKGEITLKTTVPEIPSPPPGVTANGLT
jgi:hypothetical protein